MIPSTDEEVITCGKNCPHHEQCLYSIVGLCKVSRAEAATDLPCARAMREGSVDSWFLQADQSEQTEGTALSGKFISSVGPDFWQRMGLTEEYAAKQLPVLKKWLDTYRWLCFHELPKAAPVTFH